jgi:tellurium resistance protein TerD
MNNLQLTPNTIMGFDWDEKSGVKVTLRVVPVNTLGDAETDSIVLTDGKVSAYKHSTNMGNNALVYSEYPMGKIPSGIKAMIKLQFEGLPSASVSKLIFVLTVIDTAGNPAPVQNIRSIPVWCATPKNNMDNKGTEYRLGEMDIAGLLKDGLCAVPLEIVRNDDVWTMNTLPDGCRTYNEVLRKIPGLEPFLKLPPPPPPPQSYTVSFNSNGGTPSTQSKKVTPPKTTIDSLPNEPSRAGYKFLGWTMEPNGDNLFSKSTTIDSNIVVYAQWVKDNDGKRSPPPPGNVVQLVKGQRTAIPDNVNSVSVKLNAEAPFTPDISAFILDKQTKPRAVAEELIFYNQPAGANGAIRYDTSYNYLDFDLRNIPQEIHRIAIVLSVDEPGKNFGQANKLTATFTTTENVTFVYEFDVKGSRFTAIEMCEVYRHNNWWKFNAKGEGANDGLAQLCAMYGVEIE